VTEKLIAGRRVRWDDERATEAYARGWWVRGTLADSLVEAAQRTPQRTVLIDGACQLDCRSLYGQASALAQALLARMPTGSVVSLMLPNWHEATIIYLAATMAGMVVNPILPSLRDRELLFILNDADVRMIFVPSVFGRHDYAAMMDRVAGQMDTPPEVVVVRGGGSLPTTNSPAVELPTLDPDAVRMILYTSGTTGQSKGVLHSHNSMNALICQIRDYWAVQPGDRFLVPSPIAHIGGSIYAFECPLLLGTSTVLMDRWNADEAVELIDARHCTHMAGATPFLEQLLAAAQRAGTRLPELKLFVCGGASVSPSLIRRAAEYFERAVVTRVYGSTEVPVTTVGAPLDPDNAADTDGRAGFAQIMLRDGEIHARGPQMLVGYLHPDDETGSFDADGYFRTGDLARWVDGDYLVVTGRAKDLIIRNGENIAAKEIEDILIDHPGVAEIAVVGLPDSRTGERACAVIVPTDQPHPDVAGLRSFLQAQGVATFKAPEQVVIWEQLPRNDAGKVLKHQIQAALTETDG
jgi:acyl-CoA synthetase (AMP-forming)/AMP-acid ligase II